MGFFTYIWHVNEKPLARLVTKKTLGFFTYQSGVFHLPKWGFSITGGFLITKVGFFDYVSSQSYKFSVCSLRGRPGRTHRGSLGGHPGRLFWDEIVVRFGGLY